AGMNPERIDNYDIKGIADECKANGVEFRSVHLPFSRTHSIALLDRSLSEKAMEKNMYVIDKIAPYGVKFCVIHPSTEPNEDPDRPGLLDYCAENLAKLVEFGKQYGIELAMENLPRTCLCNTSSEAIAMLDKVPGLKHCFDLNHFLPWKGEKPDNVQHIYDVKRLVGDRLISLHVSDYDFIDERHRFPLDGDNDWQGIVRALEDTDYPGYFNYEIGRTLGVEAGKTLHDVRANFDTLMAMGQNKA
ncbi:MAG: sugar phosphate isomerase/epimerase, partial [Clostridia bacterium]|nr:sugar phosphate isomerase/epimerase [Clostridia bacterium]